MNQSPFIHSHSDISEIFHHSWFKIGAPAGGEVDVALWSQGFPARHGGTPLSLEGNSQSKMDENGWWLGVAHGPQETTNFVFLLRSLICIGVHPCPEKMVFWNLLFGSEDSWGRCFPRGHGQNMPKKKKNGPYGSFSQLLPVQFYTMRWFSSIFPAGIIGSPSAQHQILAQ